MTNDALAKMSEQYQNFLAPVIKANKLSATNLEALVNFQMNALQSYVDMAMNRMKSAADISDPLPHRGCNRPVRRMCQSAASASPISRWHRSAR